MDTLPLELIYEIMKQSPETYYRLSLCSKKYLSLAKSDINKYIYSIIVNSMPKLYDKLQKLYRCRYSSDDQEKELKQYLKTHLSFDHIKQIIDVIKPQRSNLNLQIDSNMILTLNIDGGQYILDNIIATFRNITVNQFINSQFRSIVYGFEPTFIQGAQLTINLKSFASFILKVIMFYCKSKSIFLDDLPIELVRIIMQKSPNTYIKLSECSKRYYQLAINNKEELSRNRILYNLSKFCEYLQNKYCVALYPECVKEWHLEQIKNVVLKHLNDDKNFLDVIEFHEHINIIRGLLPNLDSELCEEYTIIEDMVKYFRYFGKKNE